MGFINDTIGGYLEDATDLAALKATQMRLKTTEELAAKSARIASFLLILAVASVVLALVAVAGILWLTKAVGDAAVAASIVLGAFLIVFLILFSLRNRLFRNIFVRLYSDIKSYSRLKEELILVNMRMKEREKITKFSTIKLIFNLLDKI